MGAGEQPHPSVLTNADGEVLNCLDLPNDEVAGPGTASACSCPQAWPRLRFDGGPVAGINASQVQGDDYTGFNKLGLSGGAFIDIRNPDNYWGIRLEMHYAEKGSRRGGDPEVGTTTIELRMNYIDIPVLLDVNLGDYQVGVGPYLGRMIKAEKWQRVSDTASSLEDDLNTWDIGGQALRPHPHRWVHFFRPASRRAEPP